MDALESLRAAAAAAGVDPDLIVAEAALPGIVPSDEEEAERQAARDRRLHDIAQSCVKCGEPINPQDRNVLREIKGWARHRDEGGQNHVIDRRETGRLMCGECGLRIRAGLDPAQGSLI
jgi:alkanesulfonate monooxygenase SsuD/methylene tetrahydromethanopterin reductase-like flavin-dependent oxidoreductase (luciferase family)